MRCSVTPEKYAACHVPVEVNFRMLYLMLLNGHRVQMSVIGRSTLKVARTFHGTMDDTCSNSLRLAAFHNTYYLLHIHLYKGCLMVLQKC